MPALPSSRLFACIVLALTTHGAWAQYVWVDDKGIKQFSDRPPPPSVPARRILKQPRPATSRAVDSAIDSVPAAPTLAEREADFRKRAQEKAERDRQAAEEARQRAARQQACTSARAYLAQLESGERIGAIKANGERAFIDDAERARQTGAARRALVACK